MAGDLRWDWWRAGCLGQLAYLALDRGDLDEAEQTAAKRCDFSGRTRAQRARSCHSPHSPVRRWREDSVDTQVSFGALVDAETERGPYHA